MRLWHLMFVGLEQLPLSRPLWHIPQQNPCEGLNRPQRLVRSTPSSCRWNGHTANQRPSQKASPGSWPSQCSLYCTMSPSSLKINQWIQNNFMIIFLKANLVVPLNVFWVILQEGNNCTESRKIRNPRNGHKDSNTQSSCRCFIDLKLGPWIYWKLPCPQTLTQHSILETKENLQLHTQTKQTPSPPGPL